MKTAYICTRCADRKGLTWPNGHQAKWYCATCSSCQVEGPVSKKTEWQPKQQSNKIIALR